MIGRKQTIIVAIGWSILMLVIASNLGQPSDRVLTTLLAVREHIRNDNITEALQILENAQIDNAVLGRTNLKVQEEYLWQAAITPSDFAAQLTYRLQYQAYAKRSMERWKNYIDWYHRLSSEQKNQLRPGHIRINKATAHLGNAIVRMEQYELLFDEYANIPDITYVGPDAIKLWKHWLYACSDWIPMPSSERSSEARKRIICTEQCRDYWLDYADTLEEWAGVYSLRTAVRNRRLREVSQIREVSKTCEY